MQRAALALFLSAGLALGAEYSTLNQVGFDVGVQTAGTGFSSRQFRVHNYCPTAVSFLITPGADPRPGNQQVHCNADGDCPRGMHCGLEKGVCPSTPACNHVCYWDVPKTASGSYTVQPGGSDTINWPVYDGNGIPDISWSGNIGFCTGGQCASDAATCASKGCSSGANANPVTMAEFTLQRFHMDYYDVSSIHGVSVPVEMTPKLDRSVPAYWNPWICGAAGAKYPITPQVGGCSWEFQPPSVEYNWVARGGRQCSSNSDCGSGEVCGVSDTPGTAKRLDRTCGQRLGYWSANQMCGLICEDGIPCTRLRSGVTDYMGCAARAPSGSAYSLMACAENYVRSCYQDGANSGCCGCANWQEEGVTGVPRAGTNYTKSCVSSNGAWHSTAKTRLSFLKAGCPTAYVYQYDDMTSTFTCMAQESSGSAKQNGVVYYLNMCPQLANNPGPDPVASSSTKTDTGLQGRFSIKSFFNTYLSAQQDGKLEADRTSVQAWEVFTIEKSSRTGAVFLKGAQGKYVSANPNTQEVTCDRDTAEDWETFFPESKGNNQWVFKATNGKYLQVTDSPHKVSCYNTVAAGWETMTLTPVADESVVSSHQSGTSPTSGTSGTSASQRVCECTCTGYRTHWAPCRLTYRGPNGTACAACAGTTAETTATGGPATREGPVVVARWNPQFDDIGFYRQELARGCGVPAPCVYTDDRAALATADALVFSIIYNAGLPPPGQRPPGQLYVAHCMEPVTSYFGRHLSDAAYMRQFDVRVTYQSTSDVPVNYFFVELWQSQRADGTLPPVRASEKRGLAVWVAHVCETPNRRVEYVRQLMRHVRVDSYGRCLHNADFPFNDTRHGDGWPERKERVIAPYKFTLAF
eukprot:m51a1_g1887 hypothetical protein (863) ;mRNA; f:717036-720752